MTAHLIKFLPGKNLQALGLALGILIAGLTISVLAFLSIKTELETSARQEFDFICSEIQINIEHRLDASAQALYSGAALFDASEAVSRSEWRIFTEKLRIDQQLPGTQGIGFSLLIPPAQLEQHIQAIRDEGFPDYNLRPAGDREIYSSIIYLEPFSGRNLRAFGYDMFSEAVRHVAMERARDENTAALSGKVILVQETDEDVQAGALMYVPVYQAGMPVSTIAERRAAIRGWVYSPYRMADLMRGTLGGWELRQAENHIFLQVYDGDLISDDKLMYDSRSEEEKTDTSTALNFSQAIPVNFEGHRWTLLFTQIGGLSSLVNEEIAWIVLFGGTSISLLLFGLTISMLRTRIDAQQIADQLTVDLRESEEKYRVVFNNAIYAICIFDLETLEFLDVNEAYEHLYGYNRHELLSGMDIHAITAEKQASEEATAQAAREGTTFIPLRYHRRKNGTIFPVEIVGGPYVWRGRRVMFALAHDITERKQAEDELQRQSEGMAQLLEFSQEFLQTAAANIDYQKITDHLLTIAGGKYAAFNLWDDSGTGFQTVALSGLNQHFKKASTLLGFDLQGKKWPGDVLREAKIKDQAITRFPSLADLSKKALPQPVVKLLTNIFHPGEAVIAQIMSPSQKFGDFTIIMPEGVEFKAHNLINIYTRQIGLLLQRQRAEAALNASEAKYRVLFETLPTGVSITDKTGQIIEANRVAERILDLASAEHTRRKIDGAEWSIIRPDGSPMPADEYASVRALKEQRLVNQVEMGVARGSGELAWLSVNAAPLPNYGVVITYEDISERKQIEAAERKQRLLLVSEINERRKAEEKLDQQNQVLTALYENMLDVLQFQNLDELLHLIVLRAAELLEAAYSEVMLVEDGELVIRAATPNQAFMIGDRAGPEEARISWQAVRTRETTVIDDYATWPHRRAVYDSTPTHAVVSFPILKGDQCIGVFDLSRDQTGYPFTPEQIQVGKLFVRLATLAIENSRLYAEVREFSVTDELTSLTNRRGLFQSGENEVERAIRFDHPLSIVMFDLDYFKNINDSHGHAVGDRILNAVAACCRRQVRTVDIAARYGGDEFVLVLPETVIEEAAQVAERLRASIEQISLTVEGETGSPAARVGVTASMGVVQLSLTSLNLTEILKLADVTLYDAKLHGRNRVATLNYIG